MKGLDKPAGLRFVPARSACHCVLSSVAAASTGAHTARRSDANVSQEARGSGIAATARAAAARRSSATLGRSERISSIARATIGLAPLGPARAIRSTSCRQRTAASWRSASRLVKHGQQAIIVTHRRFSNPEKRNRPPALTHGNYALKIWINDPETGRPRQDQGCWSRYSNQYFRDSGAGAQPRSVRLAHSALSPRGSVRPR